MKSRIAASLALAVTLAIPACAANAQGSELAIVVNKANPANLTKADAKKIMLGQTTTWAGGQPVVVVLSAAGSPARAAELSKSCGMTESDFTRYQLQVSFTGRTGATIHEEHSPAAIKAFVKSHPGAVAFLPKADADGDVKALAPLP